MQTPLPTNNCNPPDDTLQEFREHSDFYSNFVAPGGPQTLFWQKIYDARKQFHEGIVGQFTHIRPHIIRSWKRSSAAGAPYTGLPSVRLSAEELNNILKRNEFLLSTAKPVMQELLENIHPTSNCIILTDSNGQLIDKPRFLQSGVCFYEPISFQAAASWDVGSIGPNRTRQRD